MQFLTSKLSPATTEQSGQVRRTSLTGKRLGLAAAAAGLMAMIGWALWPKPVGVDMATVTSGPMAVQVEEEGKTRIRDVFVVSAPQSGTMLRSPLLAGDGVEKDKTIVAILQPMTPPFLDMRARLEATAQADAAEAGVRLAEAELAQARSELTFAESELSRAKSLIRTNAISARTLERSTLDVSVRKAAVAKAEANLIVKQREFDSARARLIAPSDDPHAGPFATGCCIEVKSPESGRVLRVLHTSEQVVQVGTPLLEVGNPLSKEIVVELLSTDAVKVREGAVATIDGWGGPQRLSGTVRRVEAAGFTKVSALGIEEQRVRVVIDLQPGADAGANLGHDYRVFVRIRVWESASALQVPIGALFRQGGRWSVFKVEAGRAKPVTIDVGQRNAEFAEVVAGLTAGDRVVLHPSDRVVDGGRVSERVVSER